MMLAMRYFDLPLPARSAAEKGTGWYGGERKRKVRTQRGFGVRVRFS